MLEPIEGSSPLPENGKRGARSCPNGMGTCTVTLNQDPRISTAKLIAHRERISAPRWPMRTLVVALPYSKSWRCAFVANSAPDGSFDIPNPS